MYEFKLYITGLNDQLEQSIDELKKVLKKYLNDSFKLNIIDVTQMPEETESEDIFMTPTLVKVLPEPKKKVIGDISKIETIIENII